MLKLHQPYIKKTKYRSRYTFTLASIGVLLLGSLIIVNNSNINVEVYASGDTRTLSDISTMQEMTRQICSNSNDLETNRLLDSRGGVNNYYNVVKLKNADGTSSCWMQENLKLGSNSNITLYGKASGDKQDSAFDAEFYTLPKSNDNSWSSSDTAEQIRVGKTGMTVSSQYPGDNNGWQSNYGNYYSWCAATAGTCSSATTDGAVAPGSICPKNWHLPTGGTTDNSTNEFFNLLGNNGANIGTSTASAAFAKIQQIPYLFSAAGNIYGGIGFTHPGTNGFYWSSASYDSTGAYYLIFNSLNFYPGTDNGARHRGFSVRCVAEGIEKPLFTEEAEGNINVVVPSTLTIDATSGMAENADSSKITEGTATATVSSNADYTVTLHSTQPALKDSAVANAEISPVSEANSVTPGNNSWGFWSNKTNADGSKIYDTPITTDPQEFYNTTISSITDNGNTTTHTYYVGMSIAPSLPSGTYSTDVTITASVK